MACFKLTSCTAGDTQVIWTNTDLTAYIGLTVALNTTAPGKCFTVELIEDPCNCGNLTNLVGGEVVEGCTCTTTYLCYKLEDCQGGVAPAIYVSNNLNAYVGTTISVAEYPDRCFTVTGVTLLAECEEATPEVVTCIQSCVCHYCYELTNCEAPGGIPWVVTITTTIPLTLTDVIKPQPAITQPNYTGNCWTVTDEIIPCVSADHTVTAVVNYASCIACATPVPCYKLESCNGLTTVYSTNPALLSFVNDYAQSPDFPGQCFYVSVNQDPCDTPSEFGTPTTCDCPCYLLTDCAGVITPFGTLDDLSLYVGQVVHLDQYGGCVGPCFEVSLSGGGCPNIQSVTVSAACDPCGPCNSCYVLVDCSDDRPFLTLNSPTANGVDLSLIVGQVVSEVCLGPGHTECTLGCWRVVEAPNCSAAVDAYVYDVVATCEECNATCYKLRNCETLDEIFVTYTVPHPSLPNPATLVGQTLGSFCFTEPHGGCQDGCWEVLLSDDPACPGAVDWTEVVSYTEYTSCIECLPKCYLLTECAPAVSTPIVVSNDLSLYVGSVAKICNQLGECKCYSVELAQSCDGSIVIDNANASFTTCEECNSCDCPPGYTKVGDQCQKITTVPATQNQTVWTAAPGSTSQFYGNYGTRFYSNISALPYPLIGTGVVPAAQFLDASSTPVPFVANTTGVWGGPAGSRLNTVGIWTTAAPNPIDEWIGFSQCIDIQQSGTYCIGIGGDDHVRLKIDGVLVAEVTIGLFGFQYWHVFEVTLTAGTHVIVLEGKNIGLVAPNPASLGAEIYTATSAALQAMTTAAQVQAVTLFSTFPKRTDNSPFETGENSGYSCPPGSTYSNCGAPSCSVIETIPFVECPATYRVTDCNTEGQPPFITNTDLSAYLTGSHKVCIDAPTYSTTCFLLRDCNKLVGDFYTNTNLTAYIGQAVSVTEYPGSCLIVIPQAQGGTCPTPEAVTVEDTCDCPGAQPQWPDGCYCVTVEEIDQSIATEFIGVFGQAYETCEKCSQVCYELTDCQGALDPVIVCNDLQDYVGKVIKITGCGNVCWEVALANTCENGQSFGGDVTQFNTCEDCLPPTPPEPVLELHPRKIKPGYNSPNCKLTLEYIESVNCTFAKQVYDHMLISRYGITVCCDHDIPLWTNRKAILDYELLIDPSLCKSTLCYCPKPCLTDVVLDILPSCVAPVIVNTEITIPCPVPVLTTVTLDYQPPIADCICFNVEVTSAPVTINYLDCCCKLITQTIEEVGNYPMCGSTAPVALGNPSAITVTPSGDCATSVTCNPPTCYCWKVTNQAPLPPPGESAQIGTVQFTDCNNGPVVATVFPQASVYGCSINPPTIAGVTLVIENQGECGAYCGPVPPVCQCYSIQLIDGGSTGFCEFEYTDCNGAVQTIMLTTGQTVNKCSQTLPHPNCAQIINYVVATTNTLCAPDGSCDPCICYKIDLVDNSGGLGCLIDYAPCGAPATQILLNAGTHYLCSQIVPTLNATSDCSITVTSTPTDCLSCGAPL